MNVVDISIAEKTYQNEWLLFEVTHTDEMNRPLKGKLILHSPERDVVEHKAIELRDTIQHGYLTYSGDAVPADTEAVLLSGNYRKPSCCVQPSSERAGSQRIAWLELLREFKITLDFINGSIVFERRPNLS
jgi:hypothetical protein